MESYLLDGRMSLRRDKGVQVVSGVVERKNNKGTKFIIGFYCQFCLMVTLMGFVLL